MVPRALSSRRASTQKSRVCYTEGQVLEGAHWRNVQWFSDARGLGNLHRSRGEKGFHPVLAPHAPHLGPEAGAAPDWSRAPFKSSPRPQAWWRLSGRCYEGGQAGGGESKWAPVHQSSPSLLQFKTASHIC